MNNINISKIEEVINKTSELIMNKKENKFNKVKKGIDLKTFLIAFTISISMMRKITLEGVANKCEELQYGLTLTKQALSKRLPQGKIELKNLLEEIIKITIEEKVNMEKTPLVLQQFKAVYIMDSTTISLP